jgi:CheY-like chemotaxis protein
MGEDAYRVLVVDDDPDVAMYTSTVLERRGGPSPTRCSPVPR